jgi:hypothetical protein
VPTNVNTQRLAQEFGNRVKAGGWDLGAMVAHSTFAGKASDRSNVSQIEAGKVTTTIFAELAGVSQATVNRYRRAWDLAAENSKVPGAETLTPNEVGSYTEESCGTWSSWFNQANKQVQEQETAEVTAPPTAAEVAEGTEVVSVDVIGKLERLLTTARADIEVPDDKVGVAASLMNDIIGALADKVAGLDSRLAEQRAAENKARKANPRARVAKPASETETGEKPARRARATKAPAKAPAKALAPAVDPFRV